MPKVFIGFDLPGDMTAQDLMTLLRDSFDDFRTARCNGDALAYVTQRFERLVLGSDSEADKQKKIRDKAEQVQTRMDQTRHFAHDGRNMAPVGKENQDLIEWLHNLDLGQDLHDQVAALIGMAEEEEGTYSCTPEEKSARVAATCDACHEFRCGRGYMPNCPIHTDAAVVAASKLSKPALVEAAQNGVGLGCDEE